MSGQGNGGIAAIGLLDALGVEDKELHWIEGTTRRFDGYNYFGVHPEVPVERFDRHLMH
jgi:uncharacterized protein